jgi:hypothetical protein
LTNSNIVALRMTERDQAIIKTVYEYRALTTPQIADLLFYSRGMSRRGQMNQARLRLGKLHQHGYLWRSEPPSRRTEGRNPFVYRITRKSVVEVLPEVLGIDPEEADWKPEELHQSDQHLQHLFKTNQVRITLELACKDYQIKLQQWSDDKTLNSKHAMDYVNIAGPRGGQQRTAIKPDGYFLLMAAGREFHHFLEVDLRNTNRKDWERKIKAYNAYHSSGLYKKRYNTKSLRVLTVTTTEARLETLVERTENAGGGFRFWFTTFDRLTRKSALYEPVWRVASKSGFFELVQ